MRLPRDVSGADLVALLKPLGYTITRQTGSHIRLATQQHGEHVLILPTHDHLLRARTPAAILSDVAHHFEISRDDLIGRLFPKTPPGAG